MRSLPDVEVRQLCPLCHRVNVPARVEGCVHYQGTVSGRRLIWSTHALHLGDAWHRLLESVSPAGGSGGEGALLLVEAAISGADAETRRVIEWCLVPGDPLFWVDEVEQVPALDRSGRVVGFSMYSGRPDFLEAVARRMSRAASWTEALVAGRPRSQRLNSRPNPTREIDRS